MNVELTRIGVEPRAAEAATGPGGQAAGTVETGGASGTFGAVSADQANLSFDQARVEALEAGALAAPEVRQDKVEALRAAMAGGGYGVPAEDIAGAVLNDVNAPSQA